MLDNSRFRPPQYEEGQFTAKCGGAGMMVTVQPGEEGGTWKIAYSNQHHPAPGKRTGGVSGPFRPKTRILLRGKEVLVRNGIAQCSACRDNPQGGCVYGMKT